MNEKVRRRLDSSTDKALGFLGDPHKSGSWDRRGLVVGLVQSGKTSHYIGLMNKAVDAGYKIIVVLTGFTESLRVQTQIRCDEGFLGYYRDSTSPDGESRIRIGVGNIAPGQTPDCVTTRTNDFKKAIANNFGISVGGNEILFVLKKNVSVLKNLITWIEDFGNAQDEKGKPFVEGIPLLVIDDESDVGSIDTRKGNIIDDDPDPDHEPTKINWHIRRLLSLFDQSSYVGYTATPFANVLIHDGARTEELGEDLFPRSFILSLPTPSDHVGPSMVFGTGISTDGENEPGLPIVRTIPTVECSGETAWIPPVHKATHAPLFENRNEVPPSLREAILSFILVCSARRLRLTRKAHNSMLVHATRFNYVQDVVADQVERELKGVVSRLRAKTAADNLNQELEDLWRTDFCPTTIEIAKRDDGIFQNPRHEWEEIRGELLAAASSIQVRTINGLARDVLDYENHKDGLNVIAVGGEKLSRGLTLEGLSVSYFLRCSRMYDTLMQMGRWFGFRPGYLDLCRLYTTSGLCEWFTHIAEASEELRDEFKMMVNSGATPKDFGIRVRSHPDLMVTSRVKMRHGQQFQITFHGAIVETINFRRDTETIETNRNAAERLVHEIESLNCEKSTPRQNCTLWTDVPVTNITNFLERYREHDAAIKSRTSLLREYINCENDKDRLQSWTVFVASGESQSTFTIGGHNGNRVVRNWYFGRELSKAERETKEKELKKANHFRIRRLVNPVDETVDFDEDQLEKALETTKEEFHRDPGNRKNEPTQPSGRILRELRDSKTGLLMLYPLESGDDKAESGDIPFLGFAISFPTTDGNTSQVRYTVNNVYSREEAL
ncbi:Z1 domain-containing protein [Planctomycetaceae bacterium]|nr:Z1 domain-containing protein [Planctomycetaceae bacterium]